MFKEDGGLGCKSGIVAALAQVVTLESITDARLVDIVDGGSQGL
jgi:hypothetical protein